MISPSPSDLEKKNLGVTDPKNDPRAHFENFSCLGSQN